MGGLGVLNAEPEVANPANDPCASGQAQTTSVSIPTLLSTGVASASTTSTAQNGSGSGQVANASVPPLGLTVQAATATASYGCSNGPERLGPWFGLVNGGAGILGE